MPQAAGCKAFKLSLNIRAFAEHLAVCPDCCVAVHLHCHACERWSSGDRHCRLTQRYHDWADPGQTGVPRAVGSGQRGNCQSLSPVKAVHAVHHLLGISLSMRWHISCFRCHVKGNDACTAMLVAVHRQRGGQASQWPGVSDIERAVNEDASNWVSDVTCLSHPQRCCVQRYPLHVVLALSVMDWHRHSS